MSLIESLFLGALQGITEFLPVSSSGHLVVMKNLMDLQEIPVLFDVILHVATLIVVVLVFRRRIGKLFSSLFRFFLGKKREEDGGSLRLIVTILIATMITAVIGFAVSSLEVERHPKIVSSLFIVTGIILLIVRKERGSLEYDKIGIKQAVITGVAQGLGVFPGISRSGITISGSLLSGMSRERAGEYSFILSIPAILGALILELKDLETLSGLTSPLVLTAGATSAFLVGLFSLLLLLRLVKRGKLYFFSFYLIPFGLVGLFFF